MVRYVRRSVIQKWPRAMALHVGCSICRQSTPLRVLEKLQHWSRWILQHLPSRLWPQIRVAQRRQIDATYKLGCLYITPTAPPTLFPTLYMYAQPVHSEYWHFSPPAPSQHRERCKLLLLQQSTDTIGHIQHHTNLPKALDAVPHVFTWNHPPDVCSAGQRATLLFKIKPHCTSRALQNTNGCLSPNRMNVIEDGGMIGG
jgi:hypothetical protein